MKMDLNKYLINKSFIQNFYRKNKEIYTLGYTISLCGASTGCPCIALAFYLGEDIGFTQEILDTISRFAKNYEYTEFVGAPESYYLAIK